MAWLQVPGRGVSGAPGPRTTIFFRSSSHVLARNPGRWARSDANCRAASRERSETGTSASPGALSSLSSALLSLLYQSAVALHPAPRLASSCASRLRTGSGGARFGRSEPRALSPVQAAPPHLPSTQRPEEQVTKKSGRTTPCGEQAHLARREPGRTCARKGNRFTPPGQPRCLCPSGCGLPAWVGLIWASAGGAGRGCGSTPSTSGQGCAQSRPLALGPGRTLHHVASFHLPADSGSGAEKTGQK